MDRNKDSKTFMMKQTQRWRDWLRWRNQIEKVLVRERHTSRDKKSSEDR